MTKFRVWYFDTMVSDLGIWVREFHPTKAAALASQRFAKKNFRCRLWNDLCGDGPDEGDMTYPECAEVTLTPAGVFNFLNSHTDPNGY